MTNNENFFAFLIEHVVEATIITTKEPHFIWYKRIEKNGKSRSFRISSFECDEKKTRIVLKWKL